MMIRDLQMAWKNKKLICALAKPPFVIAGNAIKREEVGE
jgi:hypothetical protein